MQRILGGAAIGFALLFSAPAHEAATFQLPAYQLNHTIPDKLTQLDPRELRCLALNIYHEARGERPEGQLAVAHVTLNRLRDPRFPKTICKVVYQPGAFSWTADRHTRREDIREEQAWELAVTIAQMAMVGMTGDPTNGALDYHATWLHPWWTADKELTGQLGHHKFYVRQTAAMAASTAYSVRYSKAALVRKMKTKERKAGRLLPTKSLFVDRGNKEELPDSTVELPDAVIDRLEAAPHDLLPLKEHG